MFSKEVAIGSSFYHLGRSVKADRNGASVLWRCFVARQSPRLTCGTPVHVGGWQVGSIRNVLEFEWDLCPTSCMTMNKLSDILNP